MQSIKKLLSWLVSKVYNPKEVLSEEDKELKYQGEFDLQEDRYYRLKGGKYLLYISHEVMFLTDGKGLMMQIPFVPMLEEGQDPSDSDEDYMEDPSEKEREELFLEEEREKFGLKAKKELSPSATFIEDLELFSQRMKHHNVITLNEILKLAEEEQFFKHCVIIRDEIRFRIKNG